MREMKHTPGPWMVSNDTGDWNVYPDGNGMSCYQAIRAGNTIVGFAVARSRGFVEPDTRANAHLIAAVPELLAALQLAVRQNSHDMLMTGEELRQCEAALSKAAPKGEKA
ncbi:hypothetical protein [Variovorax sp. tm]|uniref:hypothetical protein n=1 Tax=Variovorax atrisoli TaxID=3394203 RepID=UPI003A8102F0